MLNDRRNPSDARERKWQAHGPRVRLRRESRARVTEGGDVTRRFFGSYRKTWGTRGTRGLLYMARGCTVTYYFKGIVLLSMR